MLCSNSGQTLGIPSWEDSCRESLLDRPPGSLSEYHTMWQSLWHISVEPLFCYGALVPIVPDAAEQEEAGFLSTVGICILDFRVKPSQTEMAKDWLNCHGK